MTEEILDKLQADIETLRAFAYGDVRLKGDPPSFEGGSKRKRPYNQVINRTAYLALRRLEAALVVAHVRAVDEAEIILERKRPRTPEEV